MVAAGFEDVSRRPRPRGPTPAGVLRVSMVTLTLIGTAPGQSLRPAVADENRHAVAVVIGNRTYADPIPEVRFAHNDAEAIRRFVIEGLGYRDGNVIDLRDAKLSDLFRVFGTEGRHQGRLYNWVRAGRSDVFVFYSGHGVPGLDDKRSYLLPVDGDPNLAEITGYSLDVLYTNLAAIPARSTTVVLDTCFSGESHGGLMIPGTSGLSVRARPPDPLAELTVVTAAAGDQVASWDEDTGHGLLTAHLLRALAGVADDETWGDGDGRVTLGEVETYLADELTYTARRRFGRQQTPTIVGDATRVLADVEDEPSWFRLAQSATRQPPEPAPQPAADDSTPAETHKPGAIFKDCANCPEMVVIPAGAFQMGSPEDEEGRTEQEGPRHLVTIARPFALGRREVTFAEWDACLAAGGCGGHRPDDQGWGRDDRPVIDISFADAEAYASWLSRETGQDYGLPSEAAWEYAARAGTETPFSTGTTINSDQANYGLLSRRTMPVASFPPNAFDLYDMHGNVGEWVADCDNTSYFGAPIDGSVWAEGDCSLRIVRGGSWFISRESTLRSAMRTRHGATTRVSYVGFRVARSLDP